MSNTTKKSQHSRALINALKKLQRGNDNAEAEDQALDNAIDVLLKHIGDEEATSEFFKINKCCPRCGLYL